jgi:hypothetical protein
MALTFCTDICCQITLNLKFIIVLVTICMNLISWQTAITDIYKHPVLQCDCLFVSTTNLSCMYYFLSCVYREELSPFQLWKIVVIMTGVHGIIPLFNNKILQPFLSR